MIYPTVKFIIDRQLEANYICFLAKNIIEGRYQKAGLSVLPDSSPGGVYFPDLDYSPQFWRSIKNSGSRNLNEVFPQVCIDEVLSKLPASEISFDGRQWQKIEKEFFTLVDTFINHKKFLQKIDSIDVLVVSYGTAGSFYTVSTGETSRTFATIRLDRPAYMLVKTLLLAFYKIQQHANTITGYSGWNVRQEIVEYLITQTPFASLVPGYKRFLPDSSSLKNSSEYLKKLGFPTSNPIINLSSGKFSPQELRLLKKLQENKGKLLSFDDVAVCLWGDKSDEKFSLAAMAQIVAELRRKFRDQGINQNLISTIRGQGYVFNSLSI